MAVTEEQVRDAVRHVVDPEIAISVVDLGLVRKVDVAEDGAVTVTMTLTSPFCPEGPMIVAEVEAAARRVPGVTGARVELQWTPPWDPRKDADDEVKAMLGIWD
jgi:metal-sulfur cluster biosynthetic enzyme